MNPFQASKLLKVSNIVQNLFIHGRGGATINEDSVPWKLIQIFKPRAVLIDLGSNDIANGLSPLNTAYQLTLLADKLHNTYHVEDIILCSIINRTEGLHSTSKNKFGADIQLFNKILKTLCEDYKHLSYHLHKGTWTVPLEKLSKDGIHLNTALGRKVYTSSIRRALIGSSRNK